MCDTRTWVFKLLIVFIIIHFSRIQRCHGVNAATWTTAGAGGSSSLTGLDVAIARGPVIDTADISIDNDDNDNNNDDDSFEVVTSPPEDSLSQRSQRTNFNSTFNSSRQQQLVQSSLSSNANRLPSDEAADVVDADDDGSNEEFITNQRKFNNGGTAAIQRKELAVESSKRSSILNILQGVDYIGDTITASSTSPQSSSSASPPPQQQSQVGWDGNAAIIVDEDDEDVDEILQPMMVMASDKHHYHSNNGGRVMSQGPEAAQPGAGYPIEYNPNRNEESSGSNNPRKEAPPVTNRAKSESRISAFEQHKAIIRNNRRYGHKTHKKKYKDYLRYSPLTTTTTTTTTSSPTTSTTMSSLRKGFLARDRIFNSEDLPSRKFYEGRINYFSNNDDDDDDNDEDTDPKRDQNFRSYHNPIRQHHNTHHLRNGGGRFRHVGAPAPKTNRPHSPVYSDYNGMNFHHLGSRAMQKHQKELEKKIEEYSQYYAKWPHLAQVEDQLFEDEHTDLLYPEAGGSSPGELVLSSNDDEDNQNSKKDEEDEEDANLPPYIKKYRRRNKQLMDLLEGTKPPPSTQAPQWSSSVLKPGPIDGSHHHQHRKHHNHRQHRNHHRHKNSKWQIEDLFEEQRANPNNPNKTTIYSEIVKPTPSVVDTSTTATTTTTMTTTSTSPPSTTTTLSPFEELLKHENEHLKLLQENKLPAEDVSISRELYDWAIDTSDDQSHQDDFNEDDDEDYIDLNHNQQTQHRWKSSNRNASPIKYPTTTTTRRPMTSMRRPNAVYGSIIRSPPTTTARPINSFVYHRVVESPRAVGAGQTGRKQRLPFVAITDRRLETSRKGMGNAGVLARKDFEQNHFPMP